MFINNLNVLTESRCSDLPNPENGRVIVSGEVIGSIATYDCDDGYTLNGLSTRICRDDQEWSGVAPTCRGTSLNNYYVLMT